MSLVTIQLGQCGNQLRRVFNNTLFSHLTGDATDEHPNTAVSLKVLLITDFDIDCLSNSYYSFMPVVLVVLGIYTAALFTVILFYLFKHCNERSRLQCINI